MYLKSLTVLGFKSFADKTPLTFQPGITAIVGPNGCGKSNVADAIRWVLGEQSAKALRGGEMADVIFNGTDQRKPLGMAEVSLTIGDVEQDHLKAAGVELTYNEVTVTRRVFRDGGSEYFINRSPCRLKDIQQLFMGTGVGRTSYSIMAQGHITQILSSRPEDRRLVFEEAAGITKFKAQKREALRKLESTEQNLLRVGDLIREVKRQIGSLQRQAGKARRYKQLSLELQHLDTQLARHQFDTLEAELSDKRSALDNLRRQTEACSDRVLREEDELAQLRERLGAQEHEISQLQQQGLELRNQIEHHQSRIHFNEERLREIERQQGSTLAEIAQAEERRAAAEQEQASLAERLTASRTLLEQHRQTLRLRTESLQQTERELNGQRARLSELQSRSFAAAQELSRLRNELTALNLQKQGNLVRIEKLGAEKIQLEEERTRLETRLEEFTATVAAEKQDAASRRGSVAERQQRLKELQGQIESVNRTLDERVQLQAGQKSRLHLLEQLQSEHEGYGAGALAALQTGQVLGSLADRLQVPSQYVTAVEAALGHHLQLVLAEQPETAEQILAELQANRKGRASIAPLALQPGLSQPPPLPESAPGEAALRVIRAEEVVQPLLRQLLGDTLIVPELSQATAAWRNGGGNYTYVTLAGEVLSRQGIYTGGSQTTDGASQRPASILGRKNQIAELQSQLATLQEQIEEISRQKGALLGEQTEIQAGLQQDQTALRQQEFSIATHEGEVNALRNALQISHQRIDTVVYEIQSLATQEEEAQRQRTLLTTALAGAEDRERALADQLAEAGAGLETLQQQRESANTALTEARVAVATQEQVTDSFARQQGPLEQRARELTQLLEQRRADIGGFIQRKGQAEADSEESRQLIEGLAHRREQVNQQTAAVIGQRDALNADLTARDEALREGRRQLTEFQDRRAAHEVEIAQKTMAIQNLRDRIEQKYHLRLDDIRSECITITYADQGPAQVKTLTPEEMAAAGVATDWTAVGEQVAALQQRIDEMGPVNLVAIEEYEETEQRYQFLTTQNDDLVKAKQELTDIINRINTQTQEMFVETFNRIRDNFRVMFTEVFGGGKADLRLVNEGDVLESGIEIVARPPGKQLQSISLLSGGEQTMTAVSLLFAIYQVKPSPFCVLDELDAPLDESNINRFIRILQRFLEHSQFIIITHNKRTIGMANVLYGVTMEEQGVSQIVSVRFHKSDAALPEHPAAPLIPPPATPLVEDEEDQPHQREETFDVVTA
ncbi:MAG: chromosome segregation protein SMC [Verrucomicrobia bacterium]|nr:chromosome segregation protein SMC [Verrucomicrobiota bacterium]